MISRLFRWLLIALVLLIVVVAALIGVVVFTIVRPKLGAGTAADAGASRRVALALAIGALIGGYDGLIGPGTGAFLIFALVGLLRLDFLRASAKAKVINVATNLGALAYFVPQGWVAYAHPAVHKTAHIFKQMDGAHSGAPRRAGLLAGGGAWR